MTAEYDSIMYFINLAKRQHPVYIGSGVFLNGNMLRDIRAHLVKLKQEYGGVNVSFNSYEKAVGGVKNIFVPKGTNDGYEIGTIFSVSITHIKKPNHKKFVTVTLQEYSRPI